MIHRAGERPTSAHEGMRVQRYNERAKWIVDDVWKTSGTVVLRRGLRMIYVSPMDFCEHYSLVDDFDDKTSTDVK